MILAFFWVSIEYFFGHFLDTVLASIFRGSQGLCQSQSRPVSEGDSVVFGVLSLHKQNTSATHLNGSADVPPIRFRVWSSPSGLLYHVNATRQARGRDTDRAMAPSSAGEKDTKINSYVLLEGGGGES